MEEKSTKKREWIKNAAIIFLAVMLLLTFFSNTIMNYSLPEVATAYVNSGTITTKIRGSGVVEAEDPYSVMVKETREIQSALVKKDEHVDEGQTLYLLKDIESAELVTAQDELAKQELEYEKAILSGGFTRAEVNNIEKGSTSSLQENQAKLETLEGKVTEAENNVKSTSATVKSLEDRIAVLEKTNIDASAESNAYYNAQQQKVTADATLSQKQNAYDQADAALAQADAALKNAPTDANLIAAYNAASQILAAASQELTAAKNQVTNAQAAVDSTKLALDNKTGSTEISNQVTALNKELVTARTNAANAAATLEKAQADKEEILKEIIAEMDLVSLYDAIVAKKLKIEELQKNAVGAEIKSPVSGTVMEMRYTAGETISPDEAVATIRVDGKECSVSFSVTNEQAKRVSVGDKGEVQNSWYYNDISLTLKSIKVDSQNPSKNKILTFEVSGDVQPGQTLGVSVGQKSNNYDLIVPNSAIREDNNGKFILIVEVKSTPFGNRYVATKTEVEVLASDDTNTAISAALYGYEYVLTTANKPVEPGQQVRLIE